MSVHQISCSARVLLLDEELAALHAVPGGAVVPSELWCELEAGHAGRHAVEAQFAGGPGAPVPYTVWVRWPETDEYGAGRELIVLPPCRVDFLAGYVQEASCGLYEDHPGKHGWEFGPPLSPADLPPVIHRWLGDRPRDEL